MREEDFDALLSDSHEQYVGAKHHVVPRFYLERFANADGLVWRHDLDSGESRALPPVGIMAHRDFYTVINHDMEAVGTVEVLLQRIEADAAAVFRQLSHPRFRQIPLPPDHRLALANMMAMQALRGPKTRRSIEIMADLQMRLVLDSITEFNADAFLESRGVESTPESRGELLDVVEALDEISFASHPNQHIKVMLGVFSTLWPLIFHRPVNLVEFGEPCLWTTDEPVVPMPGIELESAGGFGTAEQIWFPIDPQRLVMLGRLNSAQPDFLIDGCTVDPKGINVAMASNAHRYVFTPDGVETEALAPFRDRPPVMDVMGGAVENLRGLSSVLAQRHPMRRFRSSDLEVDHNDAGPEQSC